MCKHPLHLSENDKTFLKRLLIKRWDCPGCSPKFRIEKPKGEDLAD